MKIYFLLALACAAAFGQTFEVASIKPAADIGKLAAGGAGLSALANVGLKVDGNRVSLGQSSLSTMIIMAYEIKPHQLVAPDWAYSQRYEVSAVMPDGATKEQVPAMLRALLADRFHLKFHRDTKEEAVYALVEAKGGHKMKPAPPEAPVVPKDPNAPAPALAKGEQELNVGGQQMRIQQAPAGSGNAAAISMSGGAAGNIKMTVPTDAASGGKMHMEMERVTMSALTDQLTSMVDLPVVDRTGLKGAYSIALDLSIQDILQQALRQAGRAGIQLPAGAQALGGGGAAGAAADPGSGSVFTSVQSLGLKLDKQKADIEHLVIDSADKTPTEN